MIFVGGQGYMCAWGGQGLCVCTRVRVCVRRGGGGGEVCVCVGGRVAESGGKRGGWWLAGITGWRG